MSTNSSVASVPERPVLPPRSGRPRLITVLLIAKLSLSLFALLAVFEQDILIGDLRAALEQMGPRSAWELRNFDRSSIAAWERALAFAMAVGLFVSVGLFGEVIRWLHMMHLNLAALGGKPRFHSRWAILGFLIPGINLVRPCQIAQEVWRESTLEEASWYEEARSTGSLAILLTWAA